MKKKNISLLMNILIVFLEIVGFIITIKNNHKISFEYYTEDSNLVALFSSLFFSYFLIRKKEIPRFVQLFKYMTTICLTITFLVVIFILIPMYRFNFNFFLFQGSLLYHHLLCPILAMLSFLLFDNLNNISKKDIKVGLSITLIYSFIIIVCNLIGAVEGPYPFLMIKKQSILESMIWFILLTTIDLIIAYSLLDIKIKKEEI